MRAQPQRTRGATSVEVAGFVGWISTAVAYVLYLLWAYIPEAQLRHIGITYYPSKYWAVAVPVWVCVAVVALYVAYESLNMMTTPTSASWKDITGGSVWSARRLPQLEGRTEVAASSKAGSMANDQLELISTMLYGPP